MLLLQSFFLPFIEIQVKICFIGLFINMTARLIKSIVRNDFFIRSALQSHLFISEFGHLTFFQYLAPELSIGETEPVSIHLNILTNKSNIRFLKDIMEKNLETEIIRGPEIGKEEAFRIQSIKLY